MVQVCGVQLDPVLGRPDENTVTACEAIAAAAAEGARLVVLPEAVLTGYVFENREEAAAAAIAVGGPELDVLAGACRTADVFAVVGAIERVEMEDTGVSTVESPGAGAAGGAGAVAEGAGGAGSDPGRGVGSALYNTAFLVGPEGLVGRYRKIHTLCLGADRFVRGGEGAFRMFELPLGRIGLNICYDGSFPESGRALRLLGAQLILLPTNWPNQALKRELVQVRAYENHVNYFAVNRVGVERSVRFDGRSVAAGPRGELLAEGGDGPERIHVEFDLEAADDSRIVESPGAFEYDRVADRRPEAYGRLTVPGNRAGRTGSRLA